jgi:putative FmdB family regulatory protein
MPLYEYKCKECGQQFESYRRLSDAGGDETCPACGARAEKVGLSLFRAKGSPSPGGSPCGSGPRRSPFS